MLLLLPSRFVLWPYIYLTQLAEQVPRAMQSFNALWYYIGGSVAAATVISLIAWYFCKRRRTGDVHFSVLFQISLTESKIRKCLNLFNMSAKEHQSISLRIEILL